MNNTNFEPWALLVLARLFVAGEKGATMANLRTAMKPWLKTTRAAEQAEELMPVLETLEQHGLCATSTKGNTTRWQCVKAGETALRQHISLPEGGRTPTWATLLAGPLMAAVMGVRPDSDADRKRIASAPGLRATVLRQAHHLPVRDIPTAREATDALLWQQLGVETRKPFSMESVKRYLLAQALGHEAGALSSSKMVSLLANKASGARRNDVRAMREALLENWLTNAQEPETEHPAAIDLKTFASQIREAAAHTSTGRFGEYLVFIHHVYSTWRNNHAEETLSLQGFKELLVQAHCRGLLELDRADLVSVMAPDDVAQSETHYLNGTFHFIRLPHGGE